MPYRVELTSRAERDLIFLYDRIHAAESEAAARWFDRLESAIFGLAKLRRRCPRAPESGTAARTLRHLLFGSKPYVYRVIFEIDEPAKTVRILTNRHGFMKGAAPPDLV